MTRTGLLQQAQANKRSSYSSPLEVMHNAIMTIDIDVVKEVSFPFNPQTDTAAEVAKEMVADLKLSCEISWLTAQLQERGNV